jgi:hypothetical protein
VNITRVHELILQAHTHDEGGIKVYESALKCAFKDELREEWENYLEEMKHHEAVLRGVCAVFRLNPDAKTPACKIVQSMDDSLVEAITKARGAGDPVAAQLIACECVTVVDGKDHLNLKLLTACAEELTGVQEKALKAACEEIRDQEVEHLCHTKGWCRELWIESLSDDEKHVMFGAG